MQWWLTLTETLRNIGLVVGGAIGIFLAWKRVTVANRQAEAQTRQAELTRRDHVAEPFNRAVGQLNDEKLEIRLGAIFTLRQICFDFEDLSEPFRINLSGAFIRRVELSDTDLEGSNFSRADCKSANFHGANLRGAKLDGTILSGADLSGARNLTRAQIDRAVIDENTILPGEFADRANSLPR